jgi:glycosyltransferase involved in cell wall biosynthesis
VDGTIENALADVSSAPPRVTVLLPAFNAAGFISDALFSLTRQFDDPSAIEVVVIDDASTDCTAEIAESYAPRFARLRVIRNDTPGGAYHARNQGLSVARGRYIAFLDADDWFAPGHLQHLADEIERIGCDFLRTDVIMTTGAARRLKRAPEARRGVALDPRSGILPYDRLTMVDHAWTQAGIYDRRLLDADLLRFRLELSTAEDRLWTWRLHMETDSYAVVDSPGFVYRQGVVSSLTQGVDERRLDYIAAFDAVRLIVADDADSESLTPKIIQSVLAITEHHLRSWDQMAPEIRTELVARVNALLRAFPVHQTDFILHSLAKDRMGRLEVVLAGVGTGRAER